MLKHELSRRSAMHQSSTLSIGLDVHKGSIAVTYVAKGIVNMLRLRLASDEQAAHSGSPCSLGNPLRARHRGPTLASFPHLAAVIRRRPPMPSWSAVVGDGAISTQQTLGLPGGCAPLPTPLALRRRPLRVVTPGMAGAPLTLFAPGT